MSNQPTHPNSQPSDGQQCDATTACCPKCIVYQLLKPFLIAIAKDAYIDASINETGTSVNLSVRDDVLQGKVLELGQDATYSVGGKLPVWARSAGADEATLKSKMLFLLEVFAHDDSKGKASRLFNKFLKKNKKIEVFTDNDLNNAVGAHSNFIGFANKTLGTRDVGSPDPTKPRIHQFLKKAGWDINKVKTIEGLGPPAFNLGKATASVAIDKAEVPINVDLPIEIGMPVKGELPLMPDPLLKFDVPLIRGKLTYPTVALKYVTTEDHANGLTVMINSVQYVFVYVQAYHYDSCKDRYEITLKFVLYDVFGLDDDDLWEYGSGLQGAKNLTAVAEGFSAWWQLQHQYGYAPLLTRAVVEKSYTVSRLG